MKAIKKPIEIEFYPCEPKYNDNIRKRATKERPIQSIVKVWFVCDTLELNITTLEWVHKATEKDMIIKGINWEVYPCKRDIFEKTYDIIK